MVVKISISPGELIDKITILELKAKLINDTKKLKVIFHEQNLLRKEFERIIKGFPKLQSKINLLKKRLYDENKKLWDTEDKLRLMESRKMFDNKFVETARKVYRFNDSRSKIKGEINTLLGSKISEVKSYAKYK